MVQSVDFYFDATVDDTRLIGRNAFLRQLAGGRAVTEVEARTVRRTEQIPATETKRLLMFAASEKSRPQRRWSKRRPTMELAMLTFWISMAPPAMPQPQASRSRRSMGNSFE